MQKYLGPNGKFYYSDSEFRELCGVHVQNWRRHADDDTFAPYRLRRGGHNLWAPAPMIESMKQILSIA